MLARARRPAELQPDLIIARRESTFMRYRANTEALQGVAAGFVFRVLQAKS